MSEQDEDRTIYGGYGWIEQIEGGGFVAVAPGGQVVAPVPVSAQRSMVLTDAALRRELDDIEDREANGLDARQFAAKLAAQEPGHDGDFSLPATLGRAEQRMRVEDVRSESAQRAALANPRPPEPTDEEERRNEQRAAARRAEAEVEGVELVARMRLRSNRQRYAVPREQRPGHGFAEPGRSPW